MDEDLKNTAAIVPTQILALAAKLAGTMRDGSQRESWHPTSRIAFLPGRRLVAANDHYIVAFYDHKLGAGIHEFVIPELQRPLALNAKAIRPFIDTTHNTSITIKVVDDVWVDLQRTPAASAGIIRTSVRYTRDFVDVDAYLKDDKDTSLSPFGVDPIYLKILADVHASLAVDCAAVLSRGGARTAVRWDLRIMSPLEEGDRAYATFMLMPMVSR